MNIKNKIIKTIITSTVLISGFFQTGCSSLGDQAFWSGMNEGLSNLNSQLDQINTQSSNSFNASTKSNSNSYNNSNTGNYQKLNLDSFNRNYSTNRDHAPTYYGKTYY